MILFNKISNKKTQNLVQFGVVPIWYGMLVKSIFIGNIVKLYFTHSKPSTVNGIHSSINVAPQGKEL